jgi:thiosulfate/3-mercaptopyruvate sulfurtransferase
VNAVIDIEELAGRLGEVLLLDVRTPGEYDGTHGQPCDPRQGHIPGAQNLDVYRLLELTPDELRAELQSGEGVEIVGVEIVAYCHSGSRSDLATKALRAHGYSARNYVGSWHEWSRTDLPIEV